VKRRCESPAEHGLQYGQDRPSANFLNDFGLTSGEDIRRGRLEAPNPGAADGRGATAAIGNDIEDAHDRPAF
jgi:hypothetical protein